MINVLPELSQYSSDHRTGTVIIESDDERPQFAIAELQGPQTRHMAIKAASIAGMSDPRINDNLTIYAIDAEGKPVLDPAKQKVHRYRADVPVIARLV